MIVYIVNYLTFSLICILNKFGRLNKKFSCILFALLQMVIVGFRHPLMGLHDTYFVFLRTLIRIYDLGLPFVQDYPKDPLFQYFTYFFTRIFGLNEPLYVFLFSMPYVIAITYLIYKYSNNIFLSFVLFVSTQMFTISFTLMRQINAMSVLILAFILLEHKKTKSFFILVIVSSFLHQASIAFLIVIFLLKLNKQRFVLLFPLLGISLSVFFTTFIQRFVHFVVDLNDRFDHMITGAEATNLTVFLIFTIITLAAFFFSRKTADVFLKKCIIISSFSLLFFSFTVINREFGRVGYLFFIFLLIAYPNSLEYIKAKEARLFVQFSSAVVLIIYFLFFLIHTTGLYPYIPFWSFRS